MNQGLKKSLSVVITCVLLLLAAVIAVTGYQFYMEYIQIREIGQNFVSVFFKNLSTQITVQVISFFIVFLLILMNFLQLLIQEETL